MSQRWTNFVKGPYLHDPVVIPTTKGLPESALIEEDPEIEGVKNSEVYERIINEPTTSLSHQNSDSTRVSTRSRSQVLLKTTKPTQTLEPPVFPNLLKLAQANGHKKLQCVLAEHDINVNERDEFGWTLLMVAACAGASECVKLLLQRGADRTLKDKKGLTALQLAEKKNLHEICSLLRNPKLREKAVAITSKRNPDTVSGYCEACNIEYHSRSIHIKSIAHLLSSSKSAVPKTHYGIPESNKGFQLLLKHGWNRERGLGPEGDGQKFPVKTVLKRDRVGLGNEELGEKQKPRVTHFGPGELAAVARPVQANERLERKRTLEKKEKAKKKCRDKKREIEFRRDLSAL